MIRAGLMAGGILLSFTLVHSPASSDVVHLSTGVRLSDVDVTSIRGGTVSLHTDGWWGRLAVGDVDAIEFSDDDAEHGSAPGWTRVWDDIMSARAGHEDVAIDQRWLNWIDRCRESNDPWWADRAPRVLPDDPGMIRRRIRAARRSSLTLSVDDALAAASDRMRTPSLLTTRARRPGRHGAGSELSADAVLMKAGDAHLAAGQVVDAALAYLACVIEHPQSSFAQEACDHAARIHRDYLGDESAAARIQQFRRRSTDT